MPDVKIFLLIIGFFLYYNNYTTGNGLIIKKQCYRRMYVRRMHNYCFVIIDFKEFHADDHGLFMNAC